MRQFGCGCQFGNGEWILCETHQKLIVVVLLGEEEANRGRER
jgi:hypothetical protein